MKTNLFLQLFVAVMRTFFPRYCVRVLTKKSNGNAFLYLLGAEKELRLIDKLDLNTNALRSRLWSLETKIGLLRKRDYSLLSEIKTEQEFDAVAASGEVKLVAQAMRYYTPNKARVLGLINQFGLETVELIKAAPTAFDFLSSSEVLGVNEKDACPVDSKRWALAEALASVKPSWAPKFMLEIRKIVPSKLNATGKALFLQFFNRAFAEKENIAELMPYMCVFFPEQYAKVRENFYFYKDFSSYFCVMFPQLSKHLSGHDDVKDLHTVALGSPLEHWADAYAWLAIGYYRLADRRIYSCILSHLTDIKHRISDEAYRQLFEALVNKAATVADVRELLSFDEDDYKVMLYSCLVSFGASNVLANFFPFADWTEELAVKAIVTLAGGNLIPIERMEELKPNLHKLAVEEMETNSQIAALRKDTFAFVSDCGKLYPRAEQELFSYDYGSQKYKLTYINRIKMSNSTFLFMLGNNDGCSGYADRIQELAFAYASKYGLTRAQYLAVLQSPIKASAPYLKPYVKADGADVEAGVGGECTL